ncbi:MAG: radical SAM protein [Blastopirellula sp.]|nr:MAG: radical SAM protein [Blastopirellula sp.]
MVDFRSKRNQVNSRRPYAYLVEPEFHATGKLVDVATLFLTNRECPYRCLMCDLWKNTLTESVAVGDIPEQIRCALSQLPATEVIKLYNSGNFFDRQAIPPEDYGEIAELVRHFDTVIVENHPNLCRDACLEFRDMIAPAQLEIALGLETCHPPTLKLLNKRMTLADFDRAARFLNAANIRTRAFLLLKPPMMDEEQAIQWTLKSLDYAFDRNVNSCSIIPTRAGNGVMEQLQKQQLFSPPQGSSLERVFQLGLQKKRGRVFVDLWDSEQFFPCLTCQAARIQRLAEMNLKQQVLPEIVCAECTS